MSGGRGEHEASPGARASRPPEPEARNERVAAGPRLSLRAGRPRSQESSRRLGTCLVGLSVPRWRATTLSRKELSEVPCKARPRSERIG